MKNEKLKIAIIGCGQIVQIMHLPYLYSSDLYEVVAICDVSNNVINNVGDKYNIPHNRRFLNYENIFDVDFNACVIATMDHYRPTLMAVKNSRHVFVEKPLAYNVEYIDEILELVTKNRLVAQVGYMKLYDPAIRYVKTVLEKIDSFNLIHIHDFAGSFSFTEDLYKLFSAEDICEVLKNEMSSFLSHSKGCSLNKSHKGLIEAYSLICGISSHDLAVLRYLFGTPKVLFSKVFNNNIVVAQMEIDNIPIQFESGYIPYRKIWDEKISVYSNDANITISFPWPYLKNCPTKVSVNHDDFDGNNVNTIYESGYQEGYDLQWIDFYNCITNGGQPIANAFDARNDIVVASELINNHKFE